MSSYVASDPWKIALVGVPSSAGARQTGQELAPGRLRKAGIVESLRSAGHLIMDLGDVPRVAYSPDREHPSRQNLHLVTRVVRHGPGRSSRP